jgi:DNA-binding HxlR family transcriptional regulator
MRKSITGHPIEGAMDVLGGRWRAILVCFLLSGPKRFSDLQKEIRIGRRMLTVNLRVLEEAGLVVRTAYAEVPPRVEYGFPKHRHGHSLLPLKKPLAASFFEATLRKSHRQVSDFLRIEPSWACWVRFSSCLFCPCPSASTEESH